MRLFSSTLLLVLLSACSSGAPRDVYQAELFPTTVSLESASLTALRASDADGTLRFDGVPPALEQLQAGQVLLGGASAVEPRGLLRFVVAVENDASGLVVRTTEAPVQLAFRRLEVHFSREVGQADEPLALTPVGSTTMGLTKTVAGEYWPPLDLDEFVFNGDGDPNTPLDQVQLTGTLSGGMRYAFTLSVDWGDVAALPQAVAECAKHVLGGSLNCSLKDMLPEAKVVFDVTAGATADVALEGVAFLGYEREIVVGTSDLPEVPVGPLVFFPEVQIIARITGAASSQFRLATHAEVGAETKITYSSTTGGSFSPPTLSKDFSAPAVEASLAAGATLAIGPRLVVSLYDVAGIYASLYANAGINADQTASPCWALTGGVDGDAGFLIKSPDLPLLGSVTLAKFGKTFGLVEEEIANGSCAIPATVGPSAAGGEPEVAAFTDPTFTPWATVYADVVDGFPHEGLGAQVEWAAITPTIDGRLMLSGSDTHTLIKVDTDGSLVWAKRYVADDVSFWTDTLIPDLLPGRVVNAGDGSLFVIAHPYAVLKVEASGALAWSERFEVPYKETWLRLTDSVDDGEGGLFVVGTYGDDPNNALESADGWLLHLGPAGEVRWSVRFGGEATGDVPRRVVRFADGIAVVGQQWDTSDDRWRGIVAWFANDGTLRWGRKLTADDCGGGNTQWLYPTAALQTRDGDLVVGAGVMHSGYQVAVMKIKPDGELAWENLSGTTTAGDLGPVPTDLVELPTSGYLAAGFYSGASTHQDIWLASLDAVGQVQWARAYGGRENAANALLVDDNYPALQMTHDGGVIVAAYSEALLGEDAIWSMKVAAKDGLIAFNPQITAETRELDLTSQTDTCLAAQPWSPTLLSLDLAPSPLAVSVHPAEPPQQNISP